MTIQVVVESQNEITLNVENYNSPAIVEVAAVGVQPQLPMFKQESRSVTALEAASQKLTLGFSANKNSFMLFNVQGALLQFRDIGWEYLQAENAVSWLGKGLDSFIEEGDIVEIIYLPLL